VPPVSEPAYVPPAGRWAEVMVPLGLEGELPDSDLSEIADRLRRPGPWVTLTLRDACPDNVLLTPAGVVLLDFEWSAPGHALVDVAHWRMGFLRCWWAGRIPDAVVEKMEGAYRAELVEAIPDSCDDARFRAELATAMVFQLLNNLHPLLVEAVEDRREAIDAGHGVPTSTARSRVLCHLEAVVAATKDAGTLPGFHALAVRWLADLRHRWPASQPLSLYPVFVDSASKRIERKLGDHRFCAAGSRLETRIDPALLDRYVGHYRLGPGFVLEVIRDGSRLFTQAPGQAKLEVFAGSDRIFFYRHFHGQLVFELDSHGRATGLVWSIARSGLERTGARIDATEAKRLSEQPRKEHKEIAINPTLLNGYIGRYQFPDQVRNGHSAALSREGDRLFWQLPGGAKYELAPQGDRDFFFKDADGELTFEVDDQGRAIRLILHEDGLDTPGLRID
jgi:hypothetical protein